MATTHIARWAGLALLAFTLSNCGKAAPVSPSTTSNLTTQQANQLAIQLGVLSVSTGLDVPLGTPTTFSTRRFAPIMRHQSAGWDTTITNENGTLYFSVNFYDSTGAEQPGYDSSSTDRLHLASWLHGEHVSAEGSFLLGTASSLDVRGLGRWSSAHHTNGARADTVHWEWADDTTSVNYTTRCTGSLDEIVRAKPVDTGYPLSGSIRWTLYVSAHVVASGGSRDETLRATATVTFNGTRYADLLVNDRFRYTLDLDTGTVTPVVS